MGMEIHGEGTGRAGVAGGGGDDGGLGGVLLMTNLMEPHFPAAVHLAAPVWAPFSSSSSSALYTPLLSEYLGNYACLKETDHSAQSLC